MLKKYFKTLFALLFVLIIVSIFSNYSKLYKNHFSILKKIALVYEALIDLKSDIISLSNFTYGEKTNNIKKIYLDIELSALEKSKINLRNNKFNKNIRKQYYDATLKFEETNIPIEIEFRMRGKNKWHHRLEKPSLRLKLKKNNPYKMMRHVNLTSPEGRTSIENYYADIVGKKIGLVAHFGEMIELIINNQSFGIYHLHSREDESFIRLNKRMPGPILLGQELNNNWDIKDFKIVNMKSISRNKDIFEKMINSIIIDKKNLKWEDFLKIWEVLNYNQFAKFFAVNSIIGNIHNDYEHNHEFYFDPTKGKIEPIISDALCCGTFLYPRGKDRVNLKTFFNNEKPNYDIGINQKTNPLLNILLLDPTFYDSRINLLNNYLNNELSPKNQKKYLEEIYKDIDDTVYKDNLKSYIVGSIGGWRFKKYSNNEYEKSKKNILFFNKERSKYLKNKLNENKLILNYLYLNEYPNKKFLKVNYRGHNSLILDTELITNSIKILNPVNGNLEEKNTKDIKIFTGLKIAQNKNKLTNLKLGKDIFHDHEYVPDFQTYIFEIENKDFEKSKIEKYFINSINNEHVKNIEWNNNEKNFIKKINYNKNSLHIWNKASDEVKKLVLGPGEVELKENLIISEKQELEILPNTLILIWPNVSIFSRGKVIADGSLGKIKLQRKFQDQHWGNFSLIGKNSNGSILKKVEISGGSLSGIQNINFSGMVSIFWNKDISLIDLNISNNTLGDDTLHFSNSSGNIKNLVINNCYADCIDFDYSKYTLENLVVEDSINDGIDFMESNIKGNNIKIKNSLDKGISAGEASKIKLKNLTISDSNIGIAVKDKSIVEINNVRLFDNLVGIDIYKKNWRYGEEGKIFLKDFEVKTNQVDLSTTNFESIKFDTKEMKVNIK